MKVFTIKKDIKYIHYTNKKDILKQQREIDKIKQKCLNKVVNKAFDYLQKSMYGVRMGKNGIPKKDKTRVDMWSLRTIWVLDDRFWCKHIVDENTSIFEKVISVGILTNEETFQLQLKRMLHLDNDKQVKDICDLLSKEEIRDITVVK